MNICVQDDFRSLGICWRPGEVILDTHTLSLPPTLPPSQYQLRTGLYDPGSGTRLTTPEGDDNILLAPLEVGE